LDEQFIEAAVMLSNCGLRIADCGLFYVETQNFASLHKTIRNPQSAINKKKCLALRQAGCREQGISVERSWES
jgi:hypothetical protein